jgi:acetyl-CoA carboxylase carboxyl transferase subunit alpha
VHALPHEKPIFEYQNAINSLRKQSKQGTLFSNEIDQLEKKLASVKGDVYSNLTSWERVLISRHPQRPHTIHYLEQVFDDFHELLGDRVYGNDKAVIGGFATISGIKCMVVGQEKGSDTESRVERNFGMVHPEGFRKALRLFRLAEKFDLPIISFIDTPGAFPGLEAEERGQGLAIAKNLIEMAVIKTPIIVLIIGEGCSGGALGMGVGDVIAMLQHAYYSVISPEGCASILWKDPLKNIDAAKALKLNAEYLLKEEIIDAIVEEPLGGAHQDPELVFKNVKEFLLDQMNILGKIPKEVLVEQRYQKFRKMGVVTR